MDGYRGGFGARAGIELGEDGTDVVVNRLRRYEQAVGDLAVAQPVGDEREDFQLPVRQSRGVLSRCLLYTSPSPRDS